jgi:hypothetical protein
VTGDVIYLSTGNCYSAIAGFVDPPSSSSPVATSSTGTNPYIPNRNTLSTKVKVDIMFERTLQDLIRGLRAHKASSKAQEDAFIQEAMVEIREELKGKDMALKGEGIIKMCYVSLLRLQNARSRQKLIAS